MANSKEVIAKKDGANNNGLSLRIGVGASSTDARQRGNESTCRGSTVYSGNGDVVVVAREGDLSVTDSSVEGINTTLAAAQKLILSTQLPRRPHQRRSGVRPGNLDSRGAVTASRCSFTVVLAAGSS